MLLTSLSSSQRLSKFCKNKYIISTTQTKKKKNLNIFQHFVSCCCDKKRKLAVNEINDMTLW